MFLRKLFVCSALLMTLAACQNKPLPTAMLEPSPVVYGQLEKNSYLKGKVAVGEFKYVPKQDTFVPRAPFYTYTNIAVEDALKKSGYLADDPAKAEYVISGVIRDVQPPKCLFGTCDTGSAIEYNLTNRKEVVVYHELLVVPYTYECPVIGGDAVVIIKQGFGGAVGNNIAHLLHVLNQKTKSDLQGSK